MSSTDKENITDNLQKIKAEGGVRTRRIGKILKTAFSEATTELKQGTTNIRPIAQEVTTTVVDNLKEKGKEATAKINDAWTDQTDSPDVIGRLQSLFHTLTQTLKQQLFPQFKQKVEALDATLTERYGDRYHTVKQRLENAQSWVAQATAETKAEPSTSVEQTQADTEAHVVTVEVVATTTEPSPQQQQFVPVNEH